MLITRITATAQHARHGIMIPHCLEAITRRSPEALTYHLSANQRGVTADGKAVSDDRFGTVTPTRVNLGKPHRIAGSFGRAFYAVTSLVGVAVHDTLSFLCPNKELTMISDENLAGDHNEPVELTDWLTKGESREIEFFGTSVVVRLVDRKGRRSRIKIVARQNAPRESDAEA